MKEYCVCFVLIINVAVFFLNLKSQTWPILKDNHFIKNWTSFGWTSLLSVWQKCTRLLPKFLPLPAYLVIIGSRITRGERTKIKSSLLPAFFFIFYEFSKGFFFWAPDCAVSRNTYPCFFFCAVFINKHLPMFSFNCAVIIKKHLSMFSFNVLSI